MVVKISKKLEMKSLLPAPHSPLPTPRSRTSFSPQSCCAAWTIVVSHLPSTAGAAPWEPQTWDELVNCLQSLSMSFAVATVPPLCPVFETYTNPEPLLPSFTLSDPSPFGSTSRRFLKDIANSTWAHTNATFRIFKTNFRSTQNTHPTKS
jgi:hypothetical protein